MYSLSPGFKFESMPLLRNFSNSLFWLVCHNNSPMTSVQTWTTFEKPTLKMMYVNVYKIVLAQLFVIVSRILVHRITCNTAVVMTSLVPPVFLIFLTIFFNSTVTISNLCIVLVILVTIWSSSISSNFRYIWENVFDTPNKILIK